MASIKFEARSPSGESRELHLDEDPNPSELVDALSHTFPESDFVQCEVTGRGDSYRVDLREGGTFSVSRLGQ